MHIVQHTQYVYVVHLWYVRYTHTTIVKDTYMVQHTFTICIMAGLWVCNTQTQCAYILRVMHTQKHTFCADLQTTCDIQCYTHTDTKCPVCVALSDKMSCTLWVYTQNILLNNSIDIPYTLIQFMIQALYIFCHIIINHCIW